MPLRQQSPEKLVFFLKVKVNCYEVIDLDVIWKGVVSRVTYQICRIYVDMYTFPINSYIFLD